MRNWASPPLYCYLGFHSHSCTHSLTHSLTHSVVRGGGCASAIEWVLQPTKMRSIWCQIPLQHGRCNKFTSYCVVSTCSIWVSHFFQISTRKSETGLRTSHSRRHKSIVWSYLSVLDLGIPFFSRYHEEKVRQDCGHPIPVDIRVLFGRILVLTCSRCRCNQYRIRFLSLSYKICNF